MSTDKNSKKSVTPDHIVKWLISHPLISYRALEIEANIPADVIRKATIGGQKLSPKHVPSLVKVLSKYGYK